MKQPRTPTGCLKRADIEAKSSTIHGLGVFATSPIAAKEIIEECPALIFNNFKLERRKVLADRVFMWGEKNRALVLGFGSLYNHSEMPNAKYFFDRELEVVRFIALEPIMSGEEIFIDYGDDYFPSRTRINQKIAVNTAKWEEVKLVFFILMLFVLSQIFPIH